MASIEWNIISKDLIDLESEPAEEMEQSHLQITNAIHKAANEPLDKTQKEKKKNERMILNLS
jgi:hypothetical protein